MTDIVTIQPSDLPETAAATETMRTMVWEPGGAPQQIAFARLFARRIDVAFASMPEEGDALGYAENSIGLVFDDPVANQNGWIRKTGGIGTGGWVLFEVLSSSAIAAMQAIRDDITGRLPTDADPDYAHKQCMTVSDTDYIATATGRRGGAPVSPPAYETARR
ncbi:MAG: hypothetical protein ACOY45_08450, partial [Pseudomonadota bacterium]